jgi:hypothetical protein
MTPTAVVDKRGNDDMIVKDGKGCSVPIERSTHRDCPGTAKQHLIIKPQAPACPRNCWNTKIGT